MAPGPDGTLYVLLPGAGATVLARLDGRGEPARGWPVRLPASSYCGLLLPATDGSIRLVCYAGDPIDGGVGQAWGFALDPDGRPLAGWPVELQCCSDGRVTGRVIGDTLTIQQTLYRGDSVDARIMSVAADGTIRNGDRVTLQNCCPETSAIGPDGVAYRIVLHINEAVTEATSELVAVGPAGLHPGFPIVIDGIASRPSFDGLGLIHVTVNTLMADRSGGPARTLVFDANGREVDAGSGELALSATGECVGIEGSCIDPIAPLVGPDGTTFVIGASFNGTTVAGLEPSGQIMAGWPYLSRAVYQALGCPPDESCDSVSLAAPAIGPNDVLYLIHSAASAAVGGTIVAVARDGRVVAGWPVELQRPGSGFFSIVVSPNGTAFALAVEPESGNESSASIVAFAPDSTVLYTTTIIEP